MFRSAKQRSELHFLSLHDVGLERESSESLPLTYFGLDWAESRTGVRERGSKEFRFR